MLVAGQALFGLQALVGEVHPGPALRRLGEAHGDQGVDRRPVLVALVPLEGEDDPFGGDDLAIDPALPQVLAGLGRAQADAPLAADPEVGRGADAPAIRPAPSTGP